MNKIEKPTRRRSAQRERIAEIIAASRRHPSALEIYDGLRKECPRLSLGNVYRNLKILVEQGRLASKTLRDGIERFDAIVSPHSHFICEKCGSVSDIEVPLMEDIAAEARKRTRHQIRGHTIQFYGTCRVCSKTGNRFTARTVGVKNKKKGERR